MGEEVGRSAVEEDIERLREVQRYGAEEAEERQCQEGGQGYVKGMSAFVPARLCLVGRLGWEGGGGVLEVLSCLHAFCMHASVIDNTMNMPCNMHLSAMHVQYASRNCAGSCLAFGVLRLQQ